MAPPFSMSRLWHHVSIPAEVDGFVIPSPTWLPHFVHVILHSLSLHLTRSSFISLYFLSLSLSSLSSFFLSSPLLSSPLLSSLLSSPLFFPLSSPLFIARGRNRFSLSHDLSLFFSSFSHSLLLFLTFFLACASLSLSLTFSLSREKRDYFFSLLSLFRKLFPSFSLFSFSRSPLLPLSHVLLPLSVSRRKAQEVKDSPGKKSSFRHRHEKSPTSSLAMIARVCFDFRLIGRVKYLNPTERARVTDGYFGGGARTREGGFASGEIVGGCSATGRAGRLGYGRER